ncbi:MAG: hypothetical protein ABR497_08915, partial [Kiritimatiellia bacterium]
MSSLEKLTPWAEKAWQTGMERLYHEKTNLIYDFITDYDTRHRFDLLPTPAEIRDQYPNPNGWATGMEDSTINGGVMLACLCDRFTATGDPRVRKEAALIYQGLKLCGCISREPGFVVRSVSPFDGASYYIETSRDQLTHFAHGLWRYFNSPLADEHQKTEMQDMMTRLAERMLRRITPENDYHFGREDGSPGLPDRMWGAISAHEFARLPLIYGVTWQMTGSDQWRKLHLEYARTAIERCAAVRLDNVPARPCYGLFQHQYALEALAALAPDADMREAWRCQMRRIAEAMPPYAAKFQN